MNNKIEKITNKEVLAPLAVAFAVLDNFNNESFFEVFVTNVILLISCI